MTDFIEIYPNVLSKEFCSHFVELIDNNPLQQPGRTGGGVDTSKKNSKDITLNHYPEFQESLQLITQACTEKISNYVESYFFTLISGITITLQHPKTKQPTVVTADNFDEIGKLASELGTYEPMTPTKSDDDWDREIELELDDELEVEVDLELEAMLT